MRKTIISLLLTIIFFMVITAETIYPQQKNSNFNIEGIMQFFKIVDILKMDKDPTSEEWKLFEEAPGYKVLNNMEFRKNFLKELMIVSFKPSEKKNEAALMEKYKNMNYYSWAAPSTLEGFKEAAKYKNEILSLAAFLQSDGALKEAESLLSKYLPGAKIDDSFKINFIVFSDSRGYDPIIMGITNPGIYTPQEEESLKKHGLNSKSPTVLIMAHEAFHNLRNKRVKFIDPPQRTLDAAVLNTFNRIENEGVADLINVKLLSSPEGCFPDREETKRTIMEQKGQHAIIAALNLILTEIAKNETIAPGIMDAIPSMNFRSGHPTGYYMANIIETQLGSEEITRIVASPYMFLESYNIAAKQLPGTPIFSDEAIQLVKKIELKYTQK